MEVGRDRAGSPLRLRLCLRRIYGTTEPLTPEEQAAKADLQAEYERLEQANLGEADLPEEADRRLGEIETALAALDERPIRFDPDEIARAGAFVSIDGQGGLRVERGFIRPEDEPVVEPEPMAEPVREPTQAAVARAENEGRVVASDPEEPEEPEDDGVLRPIPTG
jgi:ParB family chromosome partitioning protein